MINFKKKIIEILEEKIPDLSAKEIGMLIEIPPSYDLGDFAFPVFSLAKIYRKNPAIIAEDLAKEIKDENFEKIETKGAYINFFINKKKLLSTVLNEIEEKKEDFGKSNMGNGKNVLIEYSSPNIAKPFHIGHIRSTVIGDSIKRIYKFLGYNTFALNHLGDYGTQFGMLICAYKHWGDKEKIEKNPIPELLKLYVRINAEAEENEELRNESRKYFKLLEENDQEAIKIWEWFREVSLKEFNKVYKMLDIEFDSYNGESFYTDKMPAIVEELKEKNLLEDSQGAKIVNLEKEGLPSSIIIKSDGTTIYLTRDLAAAKYRKDTYKFYKNLYVVGSQQNLHFNQLRAILKKMGYEWSKDCIHIPFGMVSLEDGTLSTRKGKVVYLEDLLNKAVDKVESILEDREKIKGQKIENKRELAHIVGIGAVKFQELFNQRIKDYVFNWDKSLSFEGETGPYVQYTHARISSLLEKGNFDINKKIDVSLIKSDEEIDLIRILYNFTKAVIDAHEKYEPYIVTRYLIELAKTFNKYYTNTQILIEDEKLKNARLFLCYGVKTVLKEGLNLLGIKSPDKM